MSLPRELIHNIQHISIALRVTISIMSVAVTKMQVAILVRSSREMYQTVRIASKHILSQVRVSVRASNFLDAKNTQNLGEIGSPVRVFISTKQRPVIHRRRNRRKGALTPSRLGATDPSNSDNLNGDGGVCACACVMCLQYTIILFDPG